MNINDTRAILKSRMSNDLYVHCVGVEETALDLAVFYGVNKEKASLAGLLHDFGKIYPRHFLYRMAVEQKIADELTLLEPALLHAPVGARLLESELGLVDKEILKAVKLHTTGFPGMPPLAKIVYLADYIEPGRRCPGVSDLRELAFRDLDRALLLAVNMTMKSLLAREKLVHPHSLNFRNSLLLTIRNKQSGVNQL